jgi:hypothetical protein
MVGSGVEVKLSNPSSHPQSAEREFFLIPISSFQTLLGRRSHTGQEAQ